MIIKLKRAVAMLKLWVFLMLNYSLKLLNLKFKITYKRFIDWICDNIGFTISKNRKWWWNTILHRFFSSKTETVINENDIDGVFEPSCGTIISIIHKYLGQGFYSIIDSVIVILLIFQSRIT